MDVRRQMRSSTRRKGLGLTPRLVASGLCLAAAGAATLLVAWALRSLYLSQLQVGAVAQRWATYVTRDEAQQTTTLPDSSPPLLSGTRQAELFSEPGTRYAHSPREGCHCLEHTDLPGDAVRWGADHHTASKGECCEACTQEPKCNEWVWCGDAQSCGGQHLECWLKHRPDPWLDVDILQGMSASWTSGVTWPSSYPTPSAAQADDGAWDIALVTDAGQIRIKLQARASPQAAAFVQSVADATLRAPQEPNPNAGTRFYRAEPVPEHWASLNAPDTWQGGRWGPPYALLQGSLMPSTVSVPLPSKAGDQGPDARPVIRRGMVAWAGGGGGPDFFIALAKHPEWGNGHTVWGMVLPQDMLLVDGGTPWNGKTLPRGLSIMSRPLRVANWGTINATELVKPVAFKVVRNG